MENNYDIRKKITSKKLNELKDIIRERANNPGMNPDFDGIFSRLNSHSRIDNSHRWGYKEEKEREREEFIEKFANYVFQVIMHSHRCFSNDKLEGLDTSKFDIILAEGIKEEAYEIRESLVKYLDNIHRKYPISIGELGDSSKQDWYDAQDCIACSMLRHF